MRGPELPRLDEQLDADARHAEHRIGEPGVVGGDDQVAHAREHQPGGRARALHRGDRDLAEVADPHELVEVHRLLVHELALGRVAHRRPVLLAREELLEVVAGREVLALGREDDDADVVVGVGRSNAASSSEMSCELCAFAASGRASVIVATGPSAA